MNFIEFYKSKEIQSQTIENVEFFLDARFSADPKKNISILGRPNILNWKGDLEIVNQPNPNILSFEFASTYMLFRGMTFYGGYFKIDSCPEGPLIIDFRNFRGFHKGKRFIRAPIYQASYMKMLGVENPVIGSIDFHFKKKEWEVFLGVLENKALPTEKIAENRCGYCHGLKVEWLEDMSKICPFCSMLWVNMMVAVREILPGFYQNDPQSTQFLLGGITLLVEIRDKMPIKDQALISELYYLQSTFGFFSALRMTKSPDNPLADPDPNIKTLIEKAHKSTKFAYDYAKEKNIQEAYSTYGYLLAKINRTLKNYDIAIKLLEEGAKIDLDSGEFENYLKSLNEIYKLYLDSGKTDEIKKDYLILRENSKFITFKSLYPQRVLSSVISAALNVLDEELFKTALIDLEAYLKNIHGDSLVVNILPMSKRAEWYEKTGKLDIAKREYEGIIKLMEMSTEEKTPFDDQLKMMSIMKLKMLEEDMEKS